LRDLNLYIIIIKYNKKLALFSADIQTLYIVKTNDQVEKDCLTCVYCAVVIKDKIKSYSIM